MLCPMSGRSVVLLHGMGHDRAQWAGVVEALRDGRRVVTPDIRPGLVSVEQMTGAVDTAVPDGDRAVVGGVSMGAAVALAWAMRHPERVAGLVQVAPAVTPDGLAAEAREYLDWLAATVEAEGLAGLRVRLPDADQVAMAAEWERRFDDPADLVALWRRFPGKHPLTSWDALASLDTPALVVAWPDDPLHPLAVAETYADRLPRAELVVVDTPTTRHLPAESIARPLRAFLTSLGLSSLG